jgi:hypothetical protein
VLYTFRPAFREVTGPGKWRPETPITLKQLHEAEKVAKGGPLDLTPLHAQRESSLGLGISEPLSHKPVHLADGVDPPGTTLAIILEALERAERFKVDLDDLKLVLSQLGGRIAQFTSSDVKTQQYAEQPLYTEILARCTTML